MGDYRAWLFVHVSAVALSVALFLHRGIRSLMGTPVPRRSVMGVVPHVVDLVLLVSAIRLTFLIQQFPFVHGWLTGKVIGLVVYIGLGTVAIRGSHSPQLRRLAFAGSLLAVSYIIRTALAHSPIPF